MITCPFCFKNVTAGPSQYNKIGWAAMLKSGDYTKLSYIQEACIEHKGNIDNLLDLKIWCSVKLKNNDQIMIITSYQLDEENDKVQVICKWNNNERMDTFNLFDLDFCK